MSDHALTIRQAQPADGSVILSLIQALARKLGEDEFTKLGEIGPQTQVALLSGFHLNPEIANSFLGSGGTGPMDPTQLARLFQTTGAPPEAILFLYALRDEGTGRELQSEPLLNISGLGIADGDSARGSGVHPVGRDFGADGRDRRH